jgi:hypothetical protein
MEYLTARERDIPIFIFVEKNVLAEYDTYKRNKDAPIAYAHVESVNVFRLLDEILSRERNNFIRGFDRFDDISHWLREQWAALFADFIGKRSSDASIKDLAARVTELGQITSALKEYSELLIRKLQPEHSEQIISDQERKIEEGRVKAFSDEPMIDYLVHESRRQKGTPPIRPRRFYDAFRESRTLDEFLSIAGFSPEFRTEFIESSGGPARRDYQRIGEKYFGRGPQEDTADDGPLSIDDTPKREVVHAAPRPRATRERSGKSKGK